MTKKIILLGALTLLLNGCFETDFNFKTTVRPDGSLTRETKIDGRGAHNFAPPAGKGWEVKTYQTKGGESILEDTFYHIHATGHFRHATDMGNDYRYDSAKQFKDISDEERKNFIKLGIVEPFEETVYSKNFIQIIKHRGFFKSTVDYKETFQNKAIVELLLNDIKKEVIREQAVPLLSNGKTGDASLPKKDKAGTPSQAENVPPVTIEGKLLSSQAVESIAQDKMKKDILTKFHFHSEVSMPGKIVTSNAGSIAGKTAIWEFSMADFKPNFSSYTLEVRSEIFEWKAIVLIVILILVGFLAVGYIRNRQPKSRTVRK